MFGSWTVDPQPLSHSPPGNENQPILLMIGEDDIPGDSPQGSSQANVLEDFSEAPPRQARVGGDSAL